MHTGNIISPGVGGNEVGSGDSKCVTLYDHQRPLELLKDVIYARLCLCYIAQKIFGGDIRCGDVIGGGVFDGYDLFLVNDLADLIPLNLLPEPADPLVSRCAVLYDFIRS